MQRTVYSHPGASVPGPRCSQTWTCIVTPGSIWCQGGLPGPPARNWGVTLGFLRPPHPTHQSATGLGSTSLNVLTPIPFLPFSLLLTGSGTFPPLPSPLEPLDSLLWVGGDILGESGITRMLGEGSGRRGKQQVQRPRVLARAMCSRDSEEARREGAARSPKTAPCRTPHVSPKALGVRGRLSPWPAFSTIPVKSIGQGRPCPRKLIGSLSSNSPCTAPPRCPRAINPRVLLSFG